MTFISRTYIVTCERYCCLEKYESDPALAPASNNHMKKTVAAIAWLRHFIVNYWRFFFTLLLPRLIGDERRCKAAAYHEVEYNRSYLLSRCNRPSPSPLGTFSRRESTREYLVTYSFAFNLLSSPLSLLFCCAPPASLLDREATVDTSVVLFLNCDFVLVQNYFAWEM